MNINLDDILAGPRYPKGTAFKLADRTNRVRQAAESPIEQALGVQLVLSGRFVMLPAEHADHELHHSEVALIPQFVVGPYRLDLFMRFRDCEGEIHRIAIECDGKLYHGSPDAKQRDARRDRFLNSEGIQVWRYPGWFLHYHPHVAADEIEDAIQEVMRGQEPTLTYSHNRENSQPTIREFESAFYAHERGVPWPHRMGLSPKQRGWRGIEHMLEQLYRERNGA